MARGLLGQDGRSVKVLHKLVAVVGELTGVESFDLRLGGT